CVQQADQLAMERDLREALDRNQLSLVYQPIIELKSGSVVAVEALLRWQHPSLGLLRPRSFIPLAEAVGLIVPIGKWVTASACEQMQTWIDQGLPRLQVAVNLSPRQFDEDDLVRDVEQALIQSGLDPKLLDLEITESLAMDNVDRTRQKIIELN